MFYNSDRHINIEAIHAEACKSAWLYDTIAEACPYPFGTPAAHEFLRAFNAAKAAMPPAPAALASTAAHNARAGGAAA